MVNLSPIILIKLFLFFLNYSGGFFFHLETCTIYYFHAQFVLFDFVWDLLIVVYVPRVFFLLRLKLIFTCFSLRASYNFSIKSINEFYCVKNVAYEDLGKF